jgi:diguanylate cyclase (GGDEF)-like protein
MAWSGADTDDPDTKRRRLLMKFRAPILVPALGAAIACTALWQWCLRAEHTPIQQLAQVPAGSPIRLEGAVIATNPAGRRFWIQDKTGTLAVPLDPRRLGIRVGDTVLLDATVTHGVPQSTAVTGRSIEPRRRHPDARDSLPGNTAAQSAADPDRLLLEDAAPNVGLAFSGYRSRDTRWVLIPSLSLAWLFVLKRRTRQQKEQMMRTSGELVRATNISHNLHQLSAEIQALTKEGNFNSGVLVRDDEDLAPLSTAVNAMVGEIHRWQQISKESEARVKRMALIDDLTGLPNRRLLADRLSQSITKAQRDLSLFALLHIDLDAFKVVNDNFGHETGDVILAQAAQRLRMRYRQSDTIARLAGDEFALILDNIQEREDALRAAQSVLDCLKDPFAIDGHMIQVTASVGISIFPDAHDYGQLLQQADCAMYAAKRSGKSRIVQYKDDLGSAARERLSIEAALQYAIANGEISLQYQPEYDLMSNRIVRFEALARWNHPSLGQVGPVSFIPVAEESGLIGSLGAYVMERACTDALAWQAVARRPIQVAVNVSTVQFSQDSFFEEVAGILHRTGLHPSLLQIELTESATVGGIERAAEMIRRFTRMGVSVAVDDFGTGYSSLTYLPRLAFDTLKLDRSFVNDLMVRRDTRSFVESIIGLAHNLRMKVIVEGVETREQLQLIRSLGADEAQGHLLGQPSTEPSALLREEAKRLVLAEAYPPLPEHPKDRPSVLAITRS